MFREEFDFAVAAGARLDIGGRFEALAFFADVVHGTYFDAADDRAAGRGAGVDEFAGQVCGAAGLPVWDVGLGDDFAAGDGVCAVFAGGEEGGIVAEAGGVDDHEVGAGGDFLDPGDAVGGLGVAVELDFDFAGAASKVAGCAAGEFLHEVADFAFCLEGGYRGFFGGITIGRATVGDLFRRREYHVGGKFSENIGGSRWVLNGREYGGALARG